MPSKYRIILEMASQTARDIASNADRYTDFLITAANNYKYSFKEQLLIHAQKPDATACAEIDTWNKLGRWVNKGTKGIALLIDRDVPYKLRHVFDISDTNSRAGRNITLWQMKPEYEYAVSESLQASFGDVEEPRDFPHLLMDISGYAVEDNFSDYLMELNAVKAGSFLEELDKVRQQGYALDYFESLSHTCCVAVPVRSPEGEIYAALSFSGITDVTSREQLAYYLPQLREAAQTITRRLFLLREQV